MKNIFTFLVAHLPISIVIGVALLVCITNYIPGTFLSGWDTLHPEFNLGLYTQRVVFGAWQEHQGLGAPASQAHLAELPRLPILWLLTTLLPLSAVRYVFFFLMYVIGGLGVYLFIRHAWFEEKKEKLYDWVACIGGLFYLLNFGTLQQFSVPLEMFAVHFATLGFVFYTLYKSLKYGDTKNYFWFFVIQILTSASAHTATLFYMYNVVVFFYGFLLCFTTKGENLKRLKRFILLGFLTLSAHLYWLVPNLYYVFAHKDYVTDAKISRLFSNEAFWQNQAFGDVPDVMVLKNFLFNWLDYDFKQQKFLPLFRDWLPQLENGLGYVAAGLVAAITALGLPFLFLNDKKRERSVFFFVFLLPFFFLVNLNFPFTHLFEFFRNGSGLFEEALRFPFTKFSIVFIFALSVLLAHFLSWVLQFFKTLPTQKQQGIFSIGAVISVGFLICWASLPAIQGSLVNNDMKIVYPSYYQQFFSWFDRQSHQTRILKFPITTFEGWNYYDWSLPNHPQGYQGAGFIWFGLPQPIIDREFDRWAATNEYFYHQVDTVIRSKDQTAFQKLLTEYDIRWLMYDHSVFDPERLEKKEYEKQFFDLIQDNPNFRLVKQIGQIDVYEMVDHRDPNWIHSEPATAVQADTSFVRQDVVYKDVGNYIQRQKNSVTYPFSNLLSERIGQVSQNSNETVFSAPVQQNQTLHLPDWNKFAANLPTEVSENFDQKTENLNIILKPELPTVILGKSQFDLGSFAASSSAILHFSHIPKDSSLVLLIDNFYIPIDHLYPHQVLSTIFLPLQANSQIQLYINPPQRIDDPFAPEFVNGSCDLSSPHDLIEKKSNGLFIKGKHICAQPNQFFSYPKDGLLELIFKHQTVAENGNISVCLKDLASASCLNNKDEQQFPLSQQLKTVVLNTHIQAGTLLSPEFGVTGPVNEDKETLFSDGKLVYWPIVQELTLSPQEKTKLLPPPIDFPIQDAQSLDVLFSESSTFSLSQEANFSLIPSLHNCSRNNEGLVSTDARNDSYIYHASQKGIACETILFPGIIKDQDYVLSITNNNISGMPLEFFINESQQKTFYLEEITKQGKSHSTFSLLGDRADNGVGVHLQTTSYGPIDTQNQISQLKFTAAPLQWLAHFTSSNKGINEAKYPFISGGNLSHITRLNSGIYTAEFSGQNNENLIWLSQTYDNAWFAVSFHNNFKVFEHTKFNGWANAWILPSGKYDVIIFYWPQLLSFAGYGLLIISFMSFGIYAIVKSTKLSHPHGTI